MELNNSSVSSFLDFKKFQLLHKSLGSPSLSHRGECFEMVTKMVAAE